MATTTDTRERDTQKQSQALLICLAVVFVLGWGSYVLFDTGSTQTFAANATGYAAAFGLVYALTLSRKHGKRIAFGLLMLCIPMVSLSMLGLVGFDLPGGEGTSGKIFSSFLGAFFVALLMRLFRDYAPSREEHLYNRRMALRGLGIVFAMVAGVSVFLAGAYLLIEYVAAPVIRYFA